LTLQRWLVESENFDENSSMGPRRILLSHSGDETPAAGELALWLREMEFEVWLDVDELKPGDFKSGDCALPRL
jgi:hypothetical protein